MRPTGPDESESLVRYQQGGGHTVWSLYLPAGIDVGPHQLQPGYTSPYLALSQTDDVASEFQGFYGSDQQSGTLIIDQSNIDFGGVVSGSVDATLMRDGYTARIVGDFYAEFPE